MRVVETIGVVLVLLTAFFAVMTISMGNEISELRRARNSLEAENERQDEQLRALADVESAAPDAAGLEQRIAVLEGWRPKVETAFKRIEDWSRSVGSNSPAPAAVLVDSSRCLSAVGNAARGLANNATIATNCP